MAMAASFLPSPSLPSSPIHRLSSLRLPGVLSPNGRFVLPLKVSASARTPSLSPSQAGDNASVRAAKKAPPIVPVVMTPGGPMDLSSVLFRNRIIFIGQSVNSQVAQRVISQLLTLASIDEEEDIKIKPKVSTVCFGIAASQGALLLAGGEKGKRFAMPNARIMIHQPQGGCGGTMEDVRRQVNEVVASRDKLDKMYAAFTSQPLETVQKFTDRDRFFSAAEAMEFGLIDGLLDTEY